MRSDHCHLTAYQIGCEVGQSIVLVLRPAILDRHVLALDVAGFTDALPECGHKKCSLSRRQAAEESDYRHRGCCARAASGHAAAAPPSSVMNSRRLMLSLRPRSASYHIV